jgi:hypothetical protein
MVHISKEVYRAWIVFTLPSDIGERVELLGSWSGWKREPMNLKESGEWRLVKILKLNQKYEFGYSIDGNRWLYDENFETIETPFNSRNSVLVV